MIACCSKLFDQEAELNWIIFHDVLVTSRVYIRTVCPIRYDWVKDLLPKLHEVDVYELSSVAREEVTDEEMIKWETKEAAKRQPGSQNSLETMMLYSLMYDIGGFFLFLIILYWLIAGAMNLKH